MGPGGAEEEAEAARPRRRAAGADGALEPDPISLPPGTGLGGGERRGGEDNGRRAAFWRARENG